jgi:hypothetical protein
MVGLVVASGSPVSFRNTESAAAGCDDTREPARGNTHAMLIFPLAAIKFAA